MNIQVHIVNAFTEGQYKSSGNKAAVVLSAPHLTTQQRQEIAAHIGASETVFINKDSTKKADYEAEFYTPTRPIANCGHATVAAFSLIHEFTGKSFAYFNMAFADQNRPPQNIYTENDHIFLELPASSGNGYVIHDAPEKEIIIDALGATHAAIDHALPMAIESNGNAFLLIPVTSATALKELKPDMAKIKQLSEQFNVIGFYSYTRETSVSGRDASARMFAPAYGINEESATGMAGAALANHLYQTRGLKQSSFLIEQGHHMKAPSPSVMEARIRKSLTGRVKNILIGGQASTHDIITLEL